ncbi:MAG: phytanoyl-CoA dioxygenase family protein [Actinobacteria bacterium]|nr:MAG: phytanoyl-CoA dioxygenase family protein [Actinomycetota bacterium]
MIADERRQQLGEQGFLIVPGVLDAAEVLRLRQVLERAFDEEQPAASDTKVVRMDVLSRYPETRIVLEKQLLLDTLRFLVGEHLYLLDTVGHDSGFPSWHKDTTTLEAAGHLFHREEDFRMVQVGLYLQPNGPYGGGLDVIPGSHREKHDRFLHQPRTRVGHSFRYRVLEPIRDRKVTRIANQAGDAVIFDMRLSHRATPGLLRERPGSTPEQRKLALFFLCAGSERHARAYRAFCEQRDEYEFLGEHQYPLEVQEIARSRSLTLI